MESKPSQMRGQGVGCCAPAPHQTIQHRMEGQHRPPRLRLESWELDRLSQGTCSRTFPELSTGPQPGLAWRQLREEGRPHPYLHPLKECDAAEGGGEGCGETGNNLFSSQSLPSPKLWAFTPQHPSHSHCPSPSPCPTDLLASTWTPPWAL